MGLDFGGAGEEDFHGGFEALFESGWSHQRERGSSLGHQLCVEQKKRQTAEVIAVQMSDQDFTHLARFDLLFTHRDQGRRPAIDEKEIIGSAYRNTGLITAAAPKSIAAADKSHFDLCHIPLRVRVFRQARPRKAGVGSACDPAAHLF